MTDIKELITIINAMLTDKVLVTGLLCVAVYFTILFRGVQFRMFGEMCRVLVKSGRKYDDNRTHNAGGSVTSFQAFALSIASRVGTGNLAGVATAITVGGPGAVFWMWIIALVGASSAFVESTLAQLFKIKGEGSFRGGPAYYIQKGLGKRWWAVTFAVLISITFGLAFNSVQSNTISMSLHNSFGLDQTWCALGVSVATAALIWGGVQRVSRFSQMVVPAMALGYVLLAGIIIMMNLDHIPAVISLIFSSAFGTDAAMGGLFGSAVIMGIKRGLFSNEAGEGSTPNAAATASVTHPVKQGLVQTLGVYTDTLLVCTATAFIILVSGAYKGNAQGIVLTQQAIDSGLHSTGNAVGSVYVCIAVFVFAFTSIVANYYYGETNIRFIANRKWLVDAYRLAVCVMVYIGAITDLDLVWGFADITMTLMTLCNLVAIVMLARYVRILLADYQSQCRNGHDPLYHSSTIPEIAAETQAWD